MTDIVRATDRLGEIISYYAGQSTMFPDLDAWSASDLAELEGIINGELQRRFDEESSRVTH